MSLQVPEPPPTAGSLLGNLAEDVLVKLRTRDQRLLLTCALALACLSVYHGPCRTEDLWQHRLGDVATKSTASTKSMSSVSVVLALELRYGIFTLHVVASAFTQEIHGGLGRYSLMETASGAVKQSSGGAAPHVPLAVRRLPLLPAPAATALPPAPSPLEPSLGPGTHLTNPGRDWQRGADGNVLQTAHVEAHAESS